MVGDSGVEGGFGVNDSPEESEVVGVDPVYLIC